MVLFKWVSFTSVTYINIMEIQIYDKLLDIPNLFWSIFCNPIKHLYKFEIIKDTKKMGDYQIKKGEFLVSPFLFIF
jgi:hypothetical protein